MTPRCLLWRDHNSFPSTLIITAPAPVTGLAELACGNIRYLSALSVLLLIFITCIYLNPKAITVNNMIRGHLFFLANKAMCWVRKRTAPSPLRKRTALIEAGRSWRSGGKDTTT